MSTDGHKVIKFALSKTRSARARLLASSGIDAVIPVSISSSEEKRLENILIEIVGISIIADNARSFSSLNVFRYS